MSKRVNKRNNRQRRQIEEHRFTRNMMKILYPGQPGYRIPDPPPQKEDLPVTRTQPKSSKPRRKR